MNLNEKSTWLWVCPICGPKTISNETVPNFYGKCHVTCKHTIHSLHASHEGHRAAIIETAEVECKPYKINMEDLKEYQRPKA